MSHIDRRQFVAGLIAQIPDALIVTGLGSAAYDVFAAGDRDENFYLWGAMGLSLIHISEPTRLSLVSRMPSSA